MSRTNNIQSLEDFFEAVKATEGDIKRAVSHAATLVKNEAQRQFRNAIHNYKYARPDKYNKLADYIIRGKLKEGVDDVSVNVSGMKNKFYYDSYLTQFFVGGTIGRRGKRDGRYRGYLRANDAINKAAKSSVLVGELRRVLK